MSGSGSVNGRFPDGGSGESSGNANFRLLRYTHIFASAVREILELKLLRETSPLQLSLSQFHLLKLMAYNGQHQVHEVADFLGVSAPAATKNVDKLERFGLIVRSPSKGDRRATLLSVSPEGRRLVQKYEEIKTARLSPVLESFQPGEIEQLSDLLERFSVNLLKVEYPEDEACLRCDAYISSDCPVGQARGGCPYQMSRQARMRSAPRSMR
jgi:DNA-binding MarR family transcriptional regulator